MARARSPDRDKAFEMWRDSGGTMKLKDIADALGLSDTQIRKWKNQDRWDERLNSNVTIPKSNVTKRGGAPKGNKNAVGNAGGAAPKGNSNAVTHGFFRRIFPNDEETHAIIGEIGVKSPLDILWENIVIQYTAIARAQKIMFVRDQEDQTKVLKKFKPGMFGEEMEWELQHAWDKHAAFLQAQSRAMATLQGLIKRYEEMLVAALCTEEQRLRIEKLKLELGNLRGDTDGDAHKQNNEYEAALNAQARDVFADEVEDDGEEA